MRCRLVGILLIHGTFRLLEKALPPAFLARPMRGLGFGSSSPFRRYADRDKLEAPGVSAAAAARAGKGDELPNPKRASALGQNAGQRLFQQANVP